MEDDKIVESSPLRFDSNLEKVFYLIDEGYAIPASILVDLEGDGDLINESANQLDAMVEGSLERNRKNRRRLRKRRVKDKKKSRNSKKSWRKNRAKMKRGIKKFHKSSRGKRLKKEVSRNRKQGRYRRTHEAFLVVNRVINSLILETSFSSSVVDEVEMELMLECVSEILNPVLADLNRDICESNDSTLSKFYQISEDGSLTWTDGDIADLIHDLSRLSDFGRSISESDDSPEGELDEEELSHKYNSGQAILRRQEMEDSDEEIESTVDRLINTKEAETRLKESGMTESVFQPEEDDLDESYYMNDEVDIENGIRSINESLSDGGLEPVSEDFEVITESKGDPDVDGVNVLAKIIGPAFFPDSISRNRVEYPAGFWEVVIAKPKFQQELKARRLYGCFGHDVDITDESIRNGEISHILSDAYIKNGVGYGEWLLLNTDSGQTLKSLFGAKSKVRVSTRGMGSFVTKRNERGNKVPSSETFELLGIDFTHDPGFLAASPDGVVM